MSTLMPTQVDSRQIQQIFQGRGREMNPRTKKQHPSEIEPRTWQIPVQIRRPNNVSRLGSSTLTQVQL